MAIETNNIDLYQDSLQKLSVLKEDILSAQRAYAEELSFAQRLAERSNRNIPSEYLIPLDNEVMETPSVFGASTANNKQSSGILSVRTGEFFPKSLMESVRIILERAADNIAHWDAIVDALKKGGFQKVRNENEIMTARNNVMKSSTFVLVPENNFGLTSVYGGKKRAGRKSKDEE